MAKAFSVASWNVEHFGATTKNRRRPKKKIEPIIEYLVEQKADVVAIYEVEGAVVYDAIIKKMPDHNFHITYGPQSQEVLVGVRKKFSSFFSQRVEFKAGQETLRPGALLTVLVDGKKYPLLFLHLKSLTDPKGFGLRDDMTERALKFRRTLDKKAENGCANFIFLGDLNTMGMNLTYSTNDVSGPEEIARLGKRVARKDMVVLGKSRAKTYWPGSTSTLPESDLDHVVAADHLRFKAFGGQPVSVRGWPDDEPTNAAKDKWAKNYSDHALLYFEVQKV